MDQNDGGSFTRGPLAGALSYKTIARFEFDYLSKHQNENAAMETELIVRHFSQWFISCKTLLTCIFPQSVYQSHPSTYGWTQPIGRIHAEVEHVIHQKYFQHCMT